MMKYLLFKSVAETIAGNYPYRFEIQLMINDDLVIPKVVRDLYKQQGTPTMMIAMDNRLQSELYIDEDGEGFSMPVRFNGVKFNVVTPMANVIGVRDGVSGEAVMFIEPDTNNTKAPQDPPKPTEPPKPEKSPRKKSFLRVVK